MSIIIIFIILKKKIIKEQKIKCRSKRNGLIESKNKLYNQIYIILN